MHSTPVRTVFNSWVFITLLLGCLVSLYITYQVHLSNQRIIHQSAQQAANSLLQQVRTRIQLYQYGLRGVRGVVLTAGELGINRDIFYRYSITRDIDEEFPGANGFGFIRRVSQEQEANYVQRIQQTSWPDFSVKALSPHVTERFIIEFVEPVAPNQQAIGLDIASEVNRREAALSAIYEGEVRLTGPITLVQASGKTLQSVLILMPIYRSGQIPSAIKERNAEGFGWSYAPLIMEDVLSGLKIDQDKIQFELYDITDLDDQVCFFNNGEKGLEGDIFYATEEIYGRQWQSRLRVTPAFIQDLRLTDPILFSIFGGLITFLAAIIVAVVRINLARRQEVVAHQSRLAAVVESSADGIIGLNLEGVIHSWNKGAEHIFGYQAEEVIGQTALSILVPEDLCYEEESAFQQVRHHKQAMSLESKIKTKLGSQIPVSLTISPIFDANQKIVGISQSVRDISEHKKAEAKIRELNISLEDQVKARTSELEELNLLLKDVLQASSEISIIATNVAGEITLFNKGAERMLGYRAEEMLGQKTPTEFHTSAELDEQRAAIFEEFGVYLSDPMEVLIFKAKQKNYHSQEWTYVHKNGSRMPVSLVITQMKNSRGDSIGFLGMAMDISEQKRTQQALMAARDQLLIAAEVAQLGVWSWDVEQDSLEWSDMMYDIYRYPRSMKEEGISLQAWQARLHPEDRENTLNHFYQSVRNSKLYNDVFRIVLPDDTVRYIQAGAYIEKDEQGNTLRLTGVNQDITTERELETWLRHAKDEADAASAAKSSFLANMSHEIRTPMNAILGMLQLVKRTPLTEQQDDYINKAQISAKSLLGLINDVLDFSKVDAGKLELEQAPFDLEELLCELSTVLSGSVLAENVELIFDIDKDIPAFLIGDKLRLLQVLINLLSNAIKFTQQGSITLEIKCNISDTQTANLAIAVKDTGIGISQENLESIFDVFSQAESSTTRRFGGTGLGLVICRRFVELMGSELLVDSRLGEGSRFYFSIGLPIADGMDQDKNSLSNIVARDIKVLVAESNLASQIILARMAHNLGWQLAKADDLDGVQQALARAHNEGKAFDILLLDGKLLNDTSRRQLLAFYQTMGEDFKVPNAILLVNAIQAGQQGLDDSTMQLLKPVTLSRLSETVYQSLTHQSRETYSSRATDSVKSLAGLHLLLVEDNEFNRQVATELLTMEGAQVDVAEGGAEGVAKVLGQTTNQYDAVLMDMQMPDVDGLEATREIRMDDRFASLPIIAMTANVSVDDRQACLAAGMNDHLGKPLDIEEIIRCILAFVPHHKAFNEERSNEEAPFARTASPDTLLSQAASTNGEVSGDIASVEHESVDSILERFGGSTDLYLSVINGFESEAKFLIENIQAAAQKADIEATKEALHSLKGACLTMGLLGVSGMAGQFEQRLKQQTDESLLSACLADILAATFLVQLEMETAQIVEKINHIARTSIND